VENVEAKLDHFINAILSDAKREADALYQEIKGESDAAMNAAEDEALAAAYRHIKAEISRIESDCGRRLSHNVMENKRELFRRREAMADEVTASVKEKLSGYVKTKAYAEQLRSIISSVLATFESDATVCLRPEDMPLAETLRPAGGPYAVTFTEGSFELGGLEATGPARKLHVDETFDTSIYELRSRFSELFGLKLGE
jgi:vacuolar-type H+-ATPase subunit E/Vma4